MPQSEFTFTNDSGLRRLVHFLGPNATPTVMAWVPALFECEDDEASGKSVSPSNSADLTMVCEMTH